MNQNIWLEYGKILLPALAVLAGTYLAIKAFLDRETDKQKLELKLLNHKIITPLRLQAYERLTLFLERIKPESLLPRVYSPQMTVPELHKALLQTIRSEFEHNLSQQIYVSDEAWEMVKIAKESILKLINTAAGSKKATKNTQEYSKTIIEAYASVENSPIDVAIEKLKEEIHTQLL